MAGRFLINSPVERDYDIIYFPIDAGIEFSRLTAQGFGAENPIADNSTEEGKAKNRRVEQVKSN